MDQWNDICWQSKELLSASLCVPQWKPWDSQVFNWKRRWRKSRDESVCELFSYSSLGWQPTDLALPSTIKDFLCRCAWLKLVYRFALGVSGRILSGCEIPPGGRSQPECRIKGRELHASSHSFSVAWLRIGYSYSLQDVDLRGRPWLTRRKHEETEGFYSRDGWLCSVTRSHSPC